MDYIERILAWALLNRRGHDDGLITKTPPFKDLPKPTITLECPEIGPSDSKIPSKYGFFETGHFPPFQWQKPQQQTGDNEVKEWLLVVEDPDAPLAQPVVHGLYYSIPASKTSVSQDDFVAEEGEFKLKGGFKYGLNRRKTIYIPPRGLLGHGPHRYFYQIVALNSPVQTDALSPAATKEEIVKQIEDKVVAWGQWVGVWERK